MKNSILKSLTLSTFLFGSIPGFSQQKAAPSELDQLLDKITLQSQEDNKLNKQREQKFLNERNTQKKKLNDLKKELSKLKAEEQKLKDTYTANEKKLEKVEQELKYAAGSLGELFGVVKQVAGDSKGQFESSIISAEYPERVEFVSELSSKKQLPETKDLERLWVEIMNETIQSGKVIKFKSNVVETSGSIANKDIIRIGSFNLISDSKYLNFESDSQKVFELTRQPAGHYLSDLEDFFEAEKGVSAVAIDPSRGAILSAIVQAPSLVERFNQGGIVGYVIMGVLLSGLFITLRKLVFLTGLSKAINLQLKTNNIDNSTPLGLIKSAFDQFKDGSLDKLELALEEAIMKATKNIEKGIKTVKILAAVAPLLGLLGTVTGMIGTFQSMMLFGSGDPKLMAGGISQALVTTVLGLVAAIPLLLLHSYISEKSKNITEVIEEQTVGLLASKAKAEK